MPTMCRSRLHLADGQMAVERSLKLRVESRKAVFPLNSQHKMLSTSPFDVSQMEPVTACLLHNESASYCPWPAYTALPWRRRETECQQRDQVVGNRPEAEGIYV